MSDHSKLTALVADDNPAARAQITAILEEIGHEVVAVGDGAEALSALGALSFDLAVLDFDMPGANGADVARQGGGKPPVIALSSAGAVRDEWGDAPVADWLNKPVDARDLAASVQRLISGEAPATPQSAAPVDLDHLAAYTGGDRALESELAELFAASCTRYLDQMGSAEDDRVWREAAHGLKGAARGIGANEIGRLAAFAEKLLGSAQAKRREDVLVNLRSESGRVKDFFDQYLSASV